MFYNTLLPDGSLLITVLRVLISDSSGNLRNLPWPALLADTPRTAFTAHMASGSEKDVQRLFIRLRNAELRAISETLKEGKPTDATVTALEEIAAELGAAEPKSSPDAAYAAVLLALARLVPAVAALAAAYKDCTRSLPRISPLYNYSTVVLTA